jgi:hypothetical protein
MNITTTPDIATQSMRNWNHALRSGDSDARLLAIFDQYDGFTITAGQLPPGNENYHVYIGLDSDGDTANLEFFVVNAQYDNPGSIGTPGVIGHFPGRAIKPNAEAYEPIPDPEAVLRIENWRLNHHNWITNLLDNDGAFFQSWLVPLDDAHNEQDIYNIWFGLVVSAGPTTSDLIIQRVGTDQSYADLVRPVPPFKSGEMTEFHLLMEALR